MSPACRDLLSLQAPAMLSMKGQSRAHCAMDTRASVHVPYPTSQPRASGNRCPHITGRSCFPAPRMSDTSGSSWKPQSPTQGPGMRKVGNAGYWMKMLWMEVWAGQLWWTEGQMMGGMRQDDGMGFVPPHPMNQNDHHCSYTCVESRAQVVTEEQQMLHLHDGSRTAPDELEFTSEPQQQSFSHRQQWEAGIKTPLLQTHPNTGFCLHTPHFPQTILISARQSSQTCPLQDLSIPQKGGTAISKGTAGVPEAAINLCPPTSPPATFQPQPGGRKGRNLAGGKQQQQQPSPSVGF